MCVRQTKSSARSAPQGLILPITGYAPESLLSDNGQEVVIEIEILLTVRGGEHCEKKQNSQNYIPYYG